MPSGYTSYVLDNEDLSLREFAWICARGLGMCIMQRDDDLKSPVNIDEKPDTYHLEQIEAIHAELASIEEMSDEEYQTILDKENTEKLAWQEEYTRKAKEKVAKYNRMLDKVKDWAAEELIDVKNFMISQLEESIKWDGPHEHNFAPLQITKEQKITNLKGDLKYHEKGWQEEKDMVAERNRYKKLLSESVGPPLTETELERMR